MLLTESVDQKYTEIFPSSKPSASESGVGGARGKTAERDMEHMFLLETRHVADAAEAPGMGGRARESAGSAPVLEAQGQGGNLPCHLSHP